MRAVLLTAAAAALAGCDPEILSGSYFCGPELSCPEGQVCSQASGLCVRPEQAEPFACPPGDTGEPNDDRATATQMSVPDCPSIDVDLIGCLPYPEDRDFVAIAAPPACAGARVQIEVRYPVAFALVVADVIGAGDVVAATASPCDVTGGIGANDAVCVETTLDAGGLATIRTSLDTALDCDGACDFAHYSVKARVLAP